MGSAVAWRAASCLAVPLLHSGPSKAVKAVPPLPGRRNTRLGTASASLLFSLLLLLPVSMTVSASSSAAPTPARPNQKNVLGGALTPCTCKPTDPTTGFFRDGFCSVTSDFLSYTKSRGNDLSTPHPPFFPGLKPGDHWCLCASRWLEAAESGCAPKVVLEATHESALAICSLDMLQQHAASQSAAEAK
eukprot:jgi/Chlat1/7572/Chrsp63S07085